MFEIFHFKFSHFQAAFFVKYDRPLDWATLLAGRSDHPSLYGLALLFPGAFDVKVHLDTASILPKPNPIWTEQVPGYY